MYIPQLQNCLLVEVDYDVVTLPLKKLWFISIGLLVSTFVVSLIFSYIFSRSIVSPLETLRQGVRKIENGNIHYTVGIDTEDEIGELSRAFDKMVESVRKSREEIDQQVAIQTKEIQKTKEKLEQALQESDFVNSAMLGRELKMIELKKRLEQLQDDDADNS